MSPLGRRLAREIAERGPMRLDRFMAACLGDPQHGYYMTRDPLGAAGDFVTSPEISQVFGEILGLVLADAWLRLGEPKPVRVVELGPGRGTLAADLWRALSVVPGLCEGARLDLVETSPVLRRRQSETLARRHKGLDAAWHDDLETVPHAPLLLVANEFFDALPIRQFVRRGTDWREIHVALSGVDAFGPVEGEAAEPPVPPPQGAVEGTVYETCEPGLAIARQIGARLAAQPGLALFIDYGPPGRGFGDTFQAVRRHGYADPFAEPGERDLTAHVDFEVLALALREGGAVTWGPVRQGAFLMANGAELREAALIRGTSAVEAAEIRGAIRRLIEPAGMGSLFQVLAAGSPGLAPPPGFAP